MRSLFRSLHTLKWQIIFSFIYSNKLRLAQLNVGRDVESPNFFFSLFNVVPIQPPASSHVTEEVYSSELNLEKLRLFQERLALIISTFKCIFSGSIRQISLDRNERVISAVASQDLCSFVEAGLHYFCLMWKRKYMKYIHTPLTVGSAHAVSEIFVITLMCNANSRGLHSNSASDLIVISLDPSVAIVHVKLCRKHKALRMSAPP